MNSDISKYIKLGLFTVASVSCFAVAVYLIGDKQDMFSETFPIKAVFENVNGLKTGNNVRFAGIDIGTVRGVTIVSDTAVEVTLQVKAENRRFIKSNALATVGTDGLMGNKLVLIENVPQKASYIKNGGYLATKKETDIWEMVDKFAVTNQNLQSISAEILALTKEINAGKGSLGKLLKDDKFTDNLNSTVLSFKTSGNQVQKMMTDLNKIVSKIEKGEGSIGALLADTTMMTSIKGTLDKLDETGKQAVSLTTEINDLVKKVNSGNGAASTLLNDEALPETINATVKNLETSTGQINELLEAAKHNFLFKRYFKKKAKGKL